MLTLKQIQNLKKGDHVVIHTTFDHIDEDDDIWFKAPTHNCDRSHCFISSDYVSIPSEHGTSVPTTKHAPTRLFKKGDRIRFKTWHGFQPSDWENEAELLGKEATVYEDQKPDDFSVHFLFDGEDPEQEWHATYLPFIELVTPVEELEPYSIDPANSNVLFKRGKKFATFEDDDEAQELCDRLNAEYRKEHNND